MQLNMPQTLANNLHAVNVFKENLTKFRKFTTTVLNPVTLADLVSKFGHIYASKVTEHEFVGAAY